MIKEIKNTIPWTCVINDLKVEEIAGMFYEKELKKLKKLFNFFLENIPAISSSLRSLITHGHGIVFLISLIEKSIV